MGRQHPRARPLHELVRLTLRTGQAIELQASEHRLMVYIAASLLLVTLVLHVIYPEDKLVEYVAVTCAGFLFGKWTNGFGRRSEKQ